MFECVETLPSLKIPKILLKSKNDQTHYVIYIFDLKKGSEDKQYSKMITNSKTFEEK